MRRDSTLDVMKGIAIILVVLGHAIQANFHNFDDILLFRIIYSFHMPLFIFISGLLSINCERKYWLERRFVSLVIPFIVWILLALVIQRRVRSIRELLTSAWEIILAPDKGLWFLWVLFLCCLCMRFVKWLSQRTQRNEIYFILFIYAGLFVINRGMHVNILGIGSLRSYWIYFSLAYMLSKNRNTVLPIVKSKWFATTSVILFLSLAPLWRRGGETVYMKWFANFISEGRALQLINMMMNIIIALVGISFIYSLSRILPKFISVILERLGQHTIEVYVIHQFLGINLAQIPIGWVRVIICFGIAMGCSLLIAYIVESGLLTSVRRHIVGGANRTLFSVDLPLRWCRPGTCRRFWAE